MTETKHRRAGMKAAWRWMGESVLNFRDEILYLLIFNILWCVTSAFVITAPPATAALYAVTRELGYRRPVQWRDFFRAFRRYVFVGWRWGIMNGVIIFLIVLNLWFYNHFSADIRIPMRFIWTVLALIWAILQMYCFPVLLEQEELNVRRAVRNSAALCLRHPLFTLAYALVAATFVFISLVVPYFWLIFTGSFLAFLYNQGVYYLVQLEQGKDPALELKVQDQD